MMIKNVELRGGRAALFGMTMALLLAGCSSKTPEAPAPGPDNAEISALTNDIASVEAEVRMQRLEQRMSDLEKSLAEVQAKQEINDALADKSPVEADISPLPTKPAEKTPKR